MQLDMLHSQRATAHSVRLILVLLVTGSESQFVDEIQCDRTLSNAHLLALPVLSILGANLIDRLRQLPRRLVLLPVLLALELAGWIQHHVLHLALNVLRPGGEPCDVRVVSHLPPLVTGRRFRYLRVLRTVDEHVLRQHSLLQLAHFRMFAAASEQAGRLDLEVTDLLLMAINAAEAILLLYFLVLLLDLLLLLLRHGLTFLTLLHEIRVHLLEVALG